MSAYSHGSNDNKTVGSCALGEGQGGGGRAVVTQVCMDLYCGNALQPMDLRTLVSGGAPPVLIGSPLWLWLGTFLERTMGKTTVSKVNN